MQRAPPLTEDNSHCETLFLITVFRSRFYFCFSLCFSMLSIASGWITFESLQPKWFSCFSMEPGEKIVAASPVFRKKIRLFFCWNLSYALKQKCSLDQEFVLCHSSIISTLIFPGLCGKRVSAGTWSAEVFIATLLPDVLSFHLPVSGRWCWWCPCGARPTTFSKWLVEGSNGQEVRVVSQRSICFTTE